MADTKISALPAVGSVAGTNEFAVNEAGTSKKASATQITTYLGTVGMPRVKALAADHAISSTTATEVTGLGPMTLEAGTYTFKYSLIVQSATTSVSPMLGINFTGTAATRTFIWMFADGSTSLLAQLFTMDDEGIQTVGFISGRASKTFTTTTPNLGSTAALAVTTANVDIPCFIEGILVVTVSGDLELWHGSETATSTTVKAGSSLVVIRTA